jgi:hypothetical protein
MTDQIIINAGAAQGLQARAVRDNVLVAWIIQHDLPEYPGKFIARLAMAHPTAYVMVADTLAELRVMLPPGLVRSERQPSDPPDVVEIWFGQ